MDLIKKIVLLTTGQPTTNPRLVKEADTLALLGYQVIVVYCFWTDWADKQDLELLKDKKWNHLKVGGDNERNKYKFLLTRIRRKLYLLLNKILMKNLCVISSALFRADKELFKAALNIKADLYIAHNLGAIYPAYKAALYNKSKLAFDMEDYHPGEVITDDDKEEKRRRELILKKVLPKCDYVSFATDGFYDLTVKNLTNEIKNPIIVYNSFPSIEFIEPKHINDNKIKFIWFSQTIGRGRGLELFFEALNSVKFDYEVTLIGNFNDTAFENELKRKKNLLLLQPLPQKELHNNLSNYDIGLSLEMNSTDLNRKHALTNKLFAYLQSGLFVLATDTPAQKDFMNNNPGFGILCGQTSEEIFISINNIKNNIVDIRSKNISRFYDAKRFAWENESKKLTSVWENILG